MRRLLKFLKPYGKECAIAPSFKMLEALFELFVPIAMAKIIDTGIVSKDNDVVIKYGIIIVLLGIIGLCCSLTAQYFAAKAAIGFATDVKKEVYGKILGFSYENVDKIGVSGLITRLTNDISQVQYGVNMSLRLLLRSPFIVFGAMIMAFTISVRASLIFVIMIPVLFAIVVAITLITIPRYRNIQRSLDKLTGHIRSNLAGVKVVRAFNEEARETVEFTCENGKFYKMSLVTSRISAVLNPATLIVVNVCMLVLIAGGASLVNDGALTSGQVYALVNYMSQILVELVKLTNLLISLNKTFASADRIADTYYTENAMNNDGTVDALSIKESDVLLEFDDVSFKYPGSGAPFMEHVSLKVNKGETVGIIGGTGSGKSTLAALIMRLYDPTAGKITYCGTKLSDISLESLRKVFAYVPQKAQLFSGTLRDNLLLADPDATDERMLWAVDMAKADDILAKKGEGLDFMITEGGANLSGGQKQRITIARALTKPSRVIILDDSSSALDYATDAKLRANIRTLKDTSAIIISQRIVSIKDADIIYVMDEGHIVGAGTHASLLESCEIYREICASQNAGEEASL